MQNSDRNPYRNLEVYSIEQREQLAKLWSEGSESLYKLLIFCMTYKITKIL